MGQKVTLKQKLAFECVHVVLGTPFVRSLNIALKISYIGQAKLNAWLKYGSNSTSVVIGLTCKIELRSGLVVVNAFI